jgi:hypothetical protein
MTLIGTCDKKAGVNPRISRGIWCDSNALESTTFAKIFVKTYETLAVIGYSTGLAYWASLGSEIAFVCRVIEEGS